MAFKLIFMGTPNFAVPILKTLHESKHEISVVFTQPPKKRNRGQKLNKSPIHEFCDLARINVRHPMSLNDDEEFQFIKENNPDIVIVAAYGKILPTKYLNLKNIKFINIHASLLPRWRGAAPIQRAIIEMDKETGISIMKIVPKLDAGPFMLQEKIKIETQDNFTSLSKKLSVLGSKLILKSLDLFQSHSFKFEEQDKSKITYAKKIEKTESIINWDLPAKNLIAKINGLNPNPGVWFTHKAIRFKIIKAEEVLKNGLAGEVLDESLTIACKENAIGIKFIQKEGKKILEVNEFLSGYKIKKGEKLS